MTKTKFPESWDLFSKTAQNQWLEWQDDDFNEPLKELNYEVNTPQKQVGKSKRIFRETKNPKNLSHSLPKIKSEPNLSSVQKAIRLAYSHDHIANSIIGSSNLSTTQILQKKKQKNKNLL